MITYNDNSNDNDRKKILQIIENSAKAALVSDAGTPLISDPGYKLIEILQENNIKITPIPGPSSLIAAICASGLAVDNFTFLGFLPTNSQKKRNIVKNIDKKQSFVFFESPRRALQTLQEIFQVLGSRRVCVARELTKIYEEIKTDHIEKIIRYYHDKPEKLKGEFVIIIEKSSNIKDVTKEFLQEKILESFKSGASVKETANSIAEIYEISKKDVYEHALSLKNQIKN